MSGGAGGAPLAPELVEACPADSGPTEVEGGAVVTTDAGRAAAVKVSDPSDHG